MQETVSHDNGDNKAPNLSEKRPVLFQAQGVSISQWFEMSEDEYIRFRFAKTKAGLERERAGKQKNWKCSDLAHIRSVSRSFCA